MLARTCFVVTAVAAAVAGEARTNAAIVLVGQSRTVSASASGGPPSSQDSAAPTFGPWEGIADASSIPTGGFPIGSSSASASQTSTITTTVISGNFVSASSHQGGAFSSTGRSKMGVTFQVTDQPVQVRIDSSPFTTGQSVAFLSLTNTLNWTASTNGSTWLPQYNTTLPVGTYTFAVDVYAQSFGSQFSSGYTQSSASLTFVPAPGAGLMVLGAGGLMARRRFRRCV